MSYEQFNGGPNYETPKPRVNLEDLQLLSEADPNIDLLEVVKDSIPSGVVVDKIGRANNKFGWRYYTAANNWHWRWEMPSRHISRIAANAREPYWEDQPKLPTAILEQIELEKSNNDYIFASPYISYEYGGYDGTYVVREAEDHTNKDFKLVYDETQTDFAKKELQEALMRELGNSVDFEQFRWRVDQLLNKDRLIDFQFSGKKVSTDTLIARHAEKYISGNPNQAEELAELIVEKLIPLENHTTMSIGFQGIKAELGKIMGINRFGTYLIQEEILANDWVSLKEKLPIEKYFALNLLAKLRSQKMNKRISTLEASGARIEIENIPIFATVEKELIDNPPKGMTRLTNNGVDLMMKLLNTINKEDGGANAGQLYGLIERVKKDNEGLSLRSLIRIANMDAITNAIRLVQPEAEIPKLDDKGIADLPMAINRILFVARQDLDIEKVTGEKEELYKLVSNCVSLMVRTGVERKLNQPVTLGDLIVHPNVTDEDLKKIRFLEVSHGSRNDKLQDVYRDVKTRSRSSTWLKKWKSGYGILS
jgi:hypothetical protein